ncbi:MAG: glycosyltransferase family 1 protein, partial [Verrucomicrobia bacterium]|nr:glycosyltransferase family 1 protein [Verrucomicrobiota bacterium]
MNLVQITPGAGRMYCGNCFRDNALVSELRRLGHTALMVPLYLPVTLDEPDQGLGTPIFFGGVNVYLDQKSKLYRKAPAWVRRWLDNPKLLGWAGGRTARTQAGDVGEIMLSMLRGEEGNQTRELDELIIWLKSQTQRPDVVCLSNAL